MKPDDDAPQKDAWAIKVPAAEDLLRAAASHVGLCFSDWSSISPK